MEMTGVRARELSREFIELLSYRLAQTLRPVSASLRLTPLITAARENGIIFRPVITRSLQTESRQILLRPICDSPVNSLSSFLQLADRFSATVCVFRVELTRVSDERSSYI